LVAAGRRVRLDDRVDTSFGRRAVGWEIKGVPVRIEVGPRELAEGQVTVVRRDVGTKRPVPLAGAAAAALDDLDATQANLRDSAEAAAQARTVSVDTLEDAAEAAANGFALVPWSRLGPTGEQRLAGGGVTVRCLQRADGTLAESDDEADLVAVVAKAY
jgi:prolyl-tRNA synthetase